MFIALFCRGQIGVGEIPDICPGIQYWLAQQQPSSLLTLEDTASITPPLLLSDDDVDRLYDHIEIEELQSQYIHPRAIPLQSFFTAPRATTSATSITTITTAKKRKFLPPSATDSSDSSTAPTANKDSSEVLGAAKHSLEEDLDEIEGPGMIIQEPQVYLHAIASSAYATAFLLS